MFKFLKARKIKKYNKKHQLGEFCQHPAVDRVSWDIQRTGGKWNPGDPQVVVKCVRCGVIKLF